MCGRNALGSLNLPTLCGDGTHHLFGERGELGKRGALTMCVMRAVELSRALNQSRRLVEALKGLGQIEKDRGKTTEALS